MGILVQIGESIKARRKVLGITQRTLAELAGVGVNTLTRIEKGEGNPSLEVLLKLADTLGLDLTLTVKRQ